MTAARAPATSHAASDADAVVSPSCAGHRTISGCHPPLASISRRRWLGGGERDHWMSADYPADISGHGVRGDRAGLQDREIQTACFPKHQPPRWMWRKE